jgi:hypothetical protein
MYKALCLTLCLIVTGCNGCSNFTVAPSSPEPTGTNVNSTSPLTADAGPCNAACVQVQALCANPAPISQCILDCQRSAELENFTPYCAALLSTCEKPC